MVEMGRRFRKESSYGKLIADNPTKMAQLGIELIRQDGLLVAERDGAIVGMFGYIVHEHFMSGEKVAGEVFWWTEPEARGDGLKLLKEAESRARAAGAKYIQMIAPTERVAKLYEHRKYEFVESAYQLAL